MTSSQISDIKIVNLAEYPQWIKIVSKRYFDEWSKGDWWILDSVIYRTTHSIKKKGVPQTFVAVWKWEKPIWAVSLWFGDLSTRPDLTPWLSCLIVHPDYRKTGVWTLLQHHILKIARKLGHKYIYLCTKWEGYYERTGWEFMEIAPYRTGEKVRLYKHKI